MAKSHNPGFVQLVEDARSRIRECSVGDLHQRITVGPAPVVIDVREESEFAAGHVPGAIHLSKGIIERDIEERFSDPNTELFLICGGGYRSALAADNLRKMGYLNIISVDGGWRGWTGAGYEVEKPS
ncbi:MAG: sulfurtransferase [Planctomycetes bacterium]|nr:sulfurtransferase [Planctomycetota bacterium]